MKHAPHYTNRPKPQYLFILMYLCVGKMLSSKPPIKLFAVLFLIAFTHYAMFLTCDSSERSLSHSSSAASCLHCRTTTCLSCALIICSLCVSSCSAFVRASRTVRRTQNNSERVSGGVWKQNTHENEHTTVLTLLAENRCTCTRTHTYTHTKQS